MLKAYWIMENEFGSMIGKDIRRSITPPANCLGGIRELKFSKL